jgi:serine/threonine protein kinase
MSEDEGTDGRLLADRYRLTGVLGKGGMGTVWRAVDETLGRSVAVKELRFPGNVDEEEKQRLVTRTLREAKATARIRNTGAITVYDVVKEDDRPWIVMELVEGRSLSDAIREDGPLTPKRAAEVGLVILDVLKAAHREGILHRDVKPSNVLLGDDGRVVLSDFGIAQIDGDPSVTSTGMLVGAPSYISPERARGQKPGPPADLWSLGALLFASVEGRPPYDKGAAIATLTAVMTEPVGEMHNAGPLAEAIRGLLAKDPDRRLDNAGARAQLTAVAYAPERPAAAPATAADTRTTVLPVDPQPVPTDAPAETRAAAMDQARARDALRSLRNAAVSAKPKQKPAPEPGVPAGRPSPGRASLTDVVPRRTLLIVVAALVVALLGTVIGVALANSGDGGGDSKGGGGRTPAATPTTTTHATNTDDHKSSAPPSSSPATTPATTPPTTPAGSGVPAGWHTASGAGGSTVAVPDGWRRLTGKANHYGTGVLFSGPGGAELLVDYTDTPGPSALGKWKHDSANVGPTFTDYHQIAVKKATYRGYDAADWEYKRQLGGKQVHVLNRGFVTDAHHGYALLITFPADAWNSKADRAARDEFLETFKPAK